jgi:hypothetical protein
MPVHRIPSPMIGQFAASGAGVVDAFAFSDPSEPLNMNNLISSRPQ